MRSTRATIAEASTTIQRRDFPFFAGSTAAPDDAVERGGIEAQIGAVKEAEVEAQETQAEEVVEDAKPEEAAEAAADEAEETKEA